ncbi:hypothetical protein PCASD_05103 [Puccinia coronata f. sp. avenae]|uniref:Uncharacterized protein n=1 Tax=Puccinia coronata f. sp. avenae TaxID=200324 RepID=A0A2N5VGE4_9BASI|nr:hypothetical protein PCASD_05103 [Puccinia coronata f. sp. avenae]
MQETNGQALSRDKIRYSGGHLPPADTARTCSTPPLLNEHTHSQDEFENASLAPAGLHAQSSTTSHTISLRELDRSGLIGRRRVELPSDHGEYALMESSLGGSDH